MTSDARWSPRWLLPALIATLAAPLVVAVVSQRGEGWHPVFDLAMTELRVRDVGGPHSPLIGLQGRIGPDGSHPGPLSFYLLAPVYRLLGSSAFALQAASVAFHLGAVATALWVVARRRVGAALIALAVTLQLLILGYGLGPLTEPWNPHLPVLWFVAFLVSCWAVLDDDLPMLVPLVASASICAQTHVPYLAVTTGVAIGVVLLMVLGRRVRGEDLGLRWLLIAGATGIVLWVPPLIDEVVNEPGNLTKIVDQLGTPEDDPLGLREAGRLVLARADLWQLVVIEPQHPGTYVRVLTGPGPSEIRGAVALGLWAICAGAAVVLRHRRLLALHAVVAGGWAVAWLAVSRIHGVPWPYLMFWAFGIGALMLLAIGATLLTMARRYGPALVHADRALGLAGLALVAMLGVRLLALAPDARTDTRLETSQLARLLPPTVAGLRDGVGAATSTAGTYKVVWRDATHGGSVGIGMVNELIRRGFHVGVAAEERTRIGPHRVLDDERATAQVVYASGGWIEEVARQPGAVRVAYDDPRTPAERAEFEQVHASALEALARTGRSDLAERLDRDLFDVALNEAIDADVTPLLGRLLEIGVPSAVFVLPGGAS